MCTLFVHCKHIELVETHNLRKLLQNHNIDHHPLVVEDERLSVEPILAEDVQGVGPGMGIGGTDDSHHLEWPA